MSSLRVSQQFTSYLEFSIWISEQCIVRFLVLSKQRICPRAGTSEIFALSGFVRVDFRIDEAGTPFVLEINANPCITPDAVLNAPSYAVL